MYKCFTICFDPFHFIFQVLKMFVKHWMYEDPELIVLNKSGKQLRDISVPTIWSKWLLLLIKHQLCRYFQMFHLNSRFFWGWLKPERSVVIFLKTPVLSKRGSIKHVGAELSLSFLGLFRRWMLFWQCMDWFVTCTQFELCLFVSIQNVWRL